MKLTSNWVSGFVDGGGCFHVRHFRISQIQPEFTIVQKTSNVKVLYGLKSFFGCGTVRRSKLNLWVYRVRKRSELLDKIIPFFDKYSLKTHKKVDFIRFRWIIIQLDRGNHLTPEGLKYILRVISLMNTNKLNWKSNTFR